MKFQVNQKVIALTNPFNHTSQQRGYYILNDDNQWEFISSTLDSLTFETLFNKLNNLTPKY